jgi:hypothetical protein
VTSDGSASPIRNPARHNTTITARSRSPYALGPAARITATIPSFPFAPGVHVNYGSTVLPIQDGLPKLKDFPAELGGSGETLAE